MRFADIIGQHAAKQRLASQVDADRIPHAQLLLGPRGCGHLPLAIAFAGYVLCENRQKGTDACGACKSCQKTARLVHPDLHFAFPVVGTNAVSAQFMDPWRKAMDQNPYLDVNQWLQMIGAENRQGNINKEECLQIIRKLSLRAFEGRHKILIIWLPEYLGKEGNRLLKLIEEPPEDTLILLVAENQELILNTIVSRCQILSVQALSDDDVIRGLQEKLGLDAGRAEMLAHLVDGDFNEACRLAAQGDRDYAALFLDWLRKCYTGYGPDLVAWVDQFSTLGRENQKQLLQYGLHFLRELLVFKVSENAKLRLLEKEMQTARNLAKVLDVDKIAPMAGLFDQCALYIERNANPKILFLDASIQLNKLFKSTAQNRA